ncbi:hypothetical protein [Sphingobacterium sp.]|uniref:hypothetical protein n=1 Tax=Sphingobacterium sp. TaxID=341027 RepID=UPI0028A0C890|nr:hypothetical protein [Sphingobacterium sp.]
MIRFVKIQIVCSLIIFLIAGCDKKGNPLPSDIMFSAQLNGIKYKDVMPMVIPPGAKRTPILTIEQGDQGYINIRSSLKPEDSGDKHGDFSLNIRVPLSEQIQLNKEYFFTPIEGKEKLTGSDNLIYLDGANQFVSISSTSYNLDTKYYGKGTLVLTEYDLVKNKAKGKVEFVFPYDIWGSNIMDLKMSGEFHCWIQIPN